jgi:hypothetical protein
VTTESPIAYWLREIQAAKKRDKDYRKEGLRILEIYAGEKADTIPFNILFSNTETLLPALYSAVPRPVVDRRFKDGDPLGKAAATAGQRVLEFLLDTNVDGYETYDEAMRAATLDGLLPGRGVTCVKYDAEIGQLPTQSVDDSAPASEDAKPGVEKEGAAPGEKEPTPYKKSELVCCDARSWNRVLFGYAKKWSKVPWIAFEENIDQEEATRLFGDVVAKQLKYIANNEDEDEEKKADRDKRDRGETKSCTVYQIWDKDGGKKIRYVAEQFKEGFLKVEDDPLELTGFYNCPKPIQFIEKSNDLSPVAPYVLYENQAKELNKISKRINRIVEAIKARGVYDTELGEDIANIMKADDNELMPADKNASLSAEKGLGNAIWFMPIEQLTNVLRELYVARENCKQIIFEIMGVADIMRGESQASETLGAQQIKQTWGSLRLKRQQKEVQRYARDLLRLMLEIAATKFSEETWAKMTGLPYLTQQQFAQAQSIAQAAQQQIQAMPPQVDPQTQQPVPNPQAQQAQQQLQQAQQELQKPQWSQVLAMLKDDIQRSYRIDIETNSTVEPEAVEDQKNIADVMNALGQYLNGIGPLVQKGVMPFQAAQAMMLAIVRRFRFGAEIEDYIQQMKPPAPDQGDAQKAQMAKEAHDADMQQKQADNTAKQQELAQKAQLAERQAQLDSERMDMEMQAAREEHAMKMEDMAAKRQLNAVVTASKLRIAQATAAAKETQASHA